MKSGKAKKLNWSKYETASFNIFKHVDGAFGSCGTGALSTITGMHTESIDEHLPRGKKTWSDAAMIKFLQSKGYTIIPLNRETVCNTRSMYKTLLSPFHVLLLSQDTMVNEGTWCVAWNGWLAHNGDVTRPNFLDLIKNPLDTTYLIWHPTWKPKKDQLIKLDNINSHFDRSERASNLLRKSLKI